MPNTFTAGQDRATGYVVASALWNLLWGDEGSIDFLGEDHDHDGDAGDGANLDPFTVWLPFQAGLTVPAIGKGAWLLQDGQIEHAVASWIVPAAFGSVTSLTVYFQVDGGAGGDIKRKFEASSVAAGTDALTYSAVDAYAAVAVTQDVLTGLAATVGNLPAMVAGEVFLFLFTRDSVDAADDLGAHVYAMGVKIVYALA